MRTTGSSKTEIVYAVKQVEMGIPVRRPDSSNVPVRVLSGLRSRMSVEKASPRLVRPRGLEPPACGLGNRCSILLSYGRI